MHFRCNVGTVTEDFFSVLRATPTIGRTLVSADFVAGASPAAVLGYGAWVTNFGSEPQVIGRTIDTDIGSYTVVGVLRRGQAYPDWAPGFHTDLYVPLNTGCAHSSRTAESRQPRRLPYAGATPAWGHDRPGSPSALTRRGAAGDGVSSHRLRVRRECDPIAGCRRWRRATCTRHSHGCGAAGVSTRDRRRGQPLARARDGALSRAWCSCSDGGWPGATGPISRWRERAHRDGRGGPRHRPRAWRYTSWSPRHPGDIPRLEEITIDARAVLVASPRPSSPCSCAGSVPLATLRPAQLVGMLKGASRTTRGTRGGLRLRSGIVIRPARSVDGARGWRGAAGQGASRTFAASSSDSTRVISPFGIWAGRARRSWWIPWCGSSCSSGSLAAATVPGVVSGALVNHVPLGLAGVGSNVGVDGRDPAADTIGVGYVTITPRYFATMGIPLLRGRDFTDADMTPNAAVAIITSAMGRRYWSGWHEPAGPRAHRAERLRLRSRLPEADPGSVSSGSSGTCGEI